jgi:hypothetical protein
MTKKQAVDINESFKKIKDSIEYYKQEAVGYITFSYTLSNTLNTQMLLNDSLHLQLQEQHIIYNDEIKKLKKENKYSFVQDIIMSSIWVGAIVWFITNF